MSDLPYEYDVVISVKVKGDGIHADGDGVKATVNRLAALIESDKNVVRASRWPEISYIPKSGGET